MSLLPKTGGICNSDGLDMLNAQKCQEATESHFIDDVLKG